MHQNFWDNEAESFTIMSRKQGLNDEKQIFCYWLLIMWTDSGIYVPANLSQIMLAASEFYWHAPKFNTVQEVEDCLEKLTGSGHIFRSIRTIH